MDEDASDDEDYVLKPTYVFQRAASPTTSSRIRSACSSLTTSQTWNSFMVMEDDSDEEFLNRRG